MNKLNDINYLATLNDYQFTIIKDQMFIIVDDKEINLNDIIEREGA